MKFIAPSPKSWEQLYIDYAMNVIRGVLLGFYISRGEKLWDDYIKFYKLDTHMAMQKRHVWLFSCLKSFYLFLRSHFQVEHLSSIDNS